MRVENVSRHEIGLVAAIVLLAGILRLGWPGLTEFKADEARLLLLAYDMAEGSFARRGISSSVGFPNFPMSVWLYALPTLLWQHPYAATLFTGLLNTLGVAGCYWFVRRYWGVTAAVTATLMLAVSPWAIIFSRKIWAQNLLPLFVMGWGISAALAFGEEKRRWLWLHFLCLAIVVQIHLAAVALIPATLLFLLIFRQRVSWRHVGVGIILGSATAVPFLTYLWQQRESFAAANLFAGDGSRFTFSLDALRHVWTLSIGTEIHSLAGPQAFTIYLEQVPPALSGWVAGIWAITIIGGVLYLLVDAFAFLRPPPTPAPPSSRLKTDTQSSVISIIILLWLLVPPLFFLWHNTPLFIHYFIATLPAQYVAAGVFVSRIPYSVFRNPYPVFGPRTTDHGPRIPDHRPRTMKFAIMTVLSSTLIFQVYACGMLLAFVSTHDTPGGFGTPLALLLEAAETAVLQQQRADAPEILVANSGENPRQDPFPAIYDTLLYRTPHRFVDINHSALFPAEGAVVLLQDGVGGLRDLYLETAIVRTSLPLRTGAGQMDIILVPPAAAPAPAFPFTETYLFNNWVNPVGYGWQAAGQTAVFDLTWRTGGSPDPADYHFFNHLLDSDGQRVAQADTAAFTPGQWQEGDLVVSRFALEWPETAVPVTLRTGMYVYPSLDPILLLDVAGNPYSDAIEIRIP